MTENMTKKYDVIIIGGGPGGYVCAIRLSQLGKKVLIVEKRKTLGGTCLNVGCIPTKVLLESSEMYKLMKSHSEDFGVKTGSVSYDLAEIMARKEKIVQERCSGLDFLMKKNKIDTVTGVGRLINGQSVEVMRHDNEGSQNESPEIYAADHIVLATGSVPAQLPMAPFNQKTVISSDEAISLSKPPQNLIIIGAGAIGLELGSFWSRLGSNVSIFEMLPLLFGGNDRQIAMGAQRSLAANGIEFYLDHKITEVKVENGGVSIKALDKNEKETVKTGDVLLVAAGRKPVTGNLGLEEAGVEVQKNGKVKINAETYETTVKGVYAIGDIVDGPMLAHKAEEEGMVLAERIAGTDSHLNYNTIASVVYTSPEVAWVGEGEEQLKNRAEEYSVGRFLFRSNARANSMNETEGMVKILAQKTSGHILGVFIFGPRASELIAEAALAMKFKATVDDIIHTVHAHPTLSEVIREAALDLQKRTIHA